MNKKRWSALALGFAALLSLCGCKRDKQPDYSGSWVSFELSRSDSYYNYNFWFKVICEDDCYLLTGECIDEEGNTYQTDEGIMLPDSTVKTLRSLNLDDLEELKENKILDYFVMDAPDNRLLLTDSEGNQQKKSIGSNLSMTIYRELMPIFMENLE
jgi:hypothetical protein